MVLLLIKVAVILALLVLLKKFLWGQTELRVQHQTIEISLIWLSFSFIGLGLAIIILFLPSPAGQIIGGVLGLIGILLVI